jgi:quercetin dioxygenase-like cupin family protein
MQLDRRNGIGLICGALALAAGAAGPAGAAESASVTPVFAYDLPNLPGQKVTGVLVAYGPGGSSPPHHDTKEGSVVAYVLEGAIRSKVDDGPERVYRAGESWLEPPGASHSVSANASATEPPRLLAVSPTTAPSSPRSTSSGGRRDRCCRSRRQPQST